MHSLKGKIDSGYKRVVRSDEDGGYYRLLGFPLAIQFWFFECCPYVIGKLSLYSNVGIPRILNWPKLPKDKEGMVKMDVMNTLIFDRSLKELKLRNLTPTSVERLSLSLTDFFSGETTPEAVKFKIKGGSKPAGQPGLMGSSSSTAHENVSRVEFEEFKKCLSVVVSQQGILMKSVAEMNKKLDILIESSQGGLTHNGSQSEDALRTSENEDDEDSTSEEDEDDKFDDDKGDDHHDDETDDDDDDLGGDGVGAGQDEAHTGDVRNDEGVVVPAVVSRDDDTGKVDDAKNSDPVEPIAEIKQVYFLFGHHFCLCFFLCVSVFCVCFNSFLLFFLLSA
ncbi:nonsense-mediated mRNA decay protein 2-like isoform X2 [Cannabis sativa]|uniref:nonsense-mediated mRNA decay protein 2-like isoform X2 n=1 Tax=Cannabis sativa TaxID=3483 RepID=UPI0029CA26F3|nr:nonsense-mediated mRNA decay protein 2-like isoform X2 [Cannabis sativa]XP_060971568.1 nonsense-mediated mRNA decay protein 2-like isoform X2 [Cannabis sativa]